MKKGDLFEMEVYFLMLHVIIHDFIYYFIIYQVYMRGSSCLKWEGFEAFFIYL